MSNEEKIPADSNIRYRHHQSSLWFQDTPTSICPQLLQQAKRSFTVTLRNIAQDSEHVNIGFSTDTLTTGNRTHRSPLEVGDTAGQSGEPPRGDVHTRGKVRQEVGPAAHGSVRLLLHAPVRLFPPAWGRERKTRMS